MGQFLQTPVTWRVAVGLLLCPYSALLGGVAPALTVGWERESERLSWGNPSVASLQEREKLLALDTKTWPGSKNI